MFGLSGISMGSVKIGYMVANMQTTYVVMTDCILERHDTFEELTWIFNISVIKPSRVLHRPLMSFRRGESRIEFWIESTLTREPTELFMRSLLKRCNLPCIIRFRNDDSVS